MDRAPRPHTDEHAQLVALLGDAIRAGLDSLRLKLGSQTERVLIDRAAEHIEIAGYRLILGGDDHPSADIPDPTITNGGTNAKGTH